MHRWHEISLPRRHFNKTIIVSLPLQLPPQSQYTINYSPLVAGSYLLLALFLGHLLLVVLEHGSALRDEFFVMVQLRF